MWSAIFLLSKLQEILRIWFRSQLSKTMKWPYSEQNYSYLRYLSRHKKGRLHLKMVEQGLFREQHCRFYCLSSEKVLKVIECIYTVPIYLCLEVLFTKHLLHNCFMI